MCLRKPPELEEPRPRGDGWHSQRSSDMGWQVEPEEAHNASGHAPGMHGLVGSPRSRAVQSPAAHITHHETTPPSSTSHSDALGKLVGIARNFASGKVLAQKAAAEHPVSATEMQ